MFINTGDVIAAKSITHRILVEMKESKSGKQKPVVNQFGYSFQGEHGNLSQVGVFLFLGVCPEERGADGVHLFAEQQLRALGWRTEEPPSTNAVDPADGSDHGLTPRDA